MCGHVTQGFMKPTKLTTDITACVTILFNLCTIDIKQVKMSFKQARGATEPTLNFNTVSDVKICFSKGEQSHICTSVRENNML